MKLYTSIPKSLETFSIKSYQIIPWHIQTETIKKLGAISSGPLSLDNDILMCKAMSIGNPGGANVPPYNLFPIEKELQEILAKVRVVDSKI